MNATSEPSLTLAPEQCVRLGDGVRRIVAGNAGLMTGPGTNTYLIGTREVAVLDPGPDEDRHLAAILDAADGRIRLIIVTHTHSDHSPLARRLKERTQAPVIGMRAPRDGRQDPAFVPDREPADGERIPVDGRDLIALHTPGHASNCVCYLLERERLLFTGDHVLEGVSPVILPPDGDMAAYLDSLDKLSRIDFESIAPGHGRLMSDGPRVVAALRRHRLAREDKVLRSLERIGESSIETLTPTVYDDVDPERHRWARLTLEAHLIKLAADGRVAERGGLWRTQP